MNAVSTTKVLIGAVAVLAVLGLTPASALSPTTGSAVPAWAAATLQERGQAADALRNALSAGNLADAYRATGAQTQPLPTGALPVEQAAKLAALPVELRAPVARLWAATSAADALLGSISKSQLHAWHRDVLAVLADPSRKPTATTPTTAAERSQAMATVLSALDDTLPLLRANAPAASGATADSCDYLDLRPRLCIGSEADNLHSQDATLVIDLGGSDTYESTAGGAPFPVNDTPYRYSLLSVSVDLDGDDVYSATRRSPSVLMQSFTYGQGAGVVGAVGVLVDAAGDDRYGVTQQMAREEILGGTHAYYGGVVVQGSGMAGAGALIDMAGSDSYTASIAKGEPPSEPVQHRVLYLNAQGAASDSFSCAGEPDDVMGTRQGCSEGLLLDLQRGDDTYEAEAELPDRLPGVEQSASISVMAQAASGISQDTVATLVDGGGTDVFRTDTVVSWHRDTPATIGYMGSVAAQGAHIGGQLITGEGPTTYDTSIQEHGSSALAGMFIRAQGASGLLDDASGDDEYRLTYTQRDVQRRERTACSGQSQSCTAGRTAVIGGSNNARIEVQGVGSNGHGILRDGGGNDRYIAAADRHLEVDIEDSSENSTAPLFVSAYTDAALLAQGMGLVKPFGGLLLDVGGTDTYDVSGNNRLQVDPETAGGGITTYLNSWPGGISAQGAGERAAFLDLGGAGDHMRVSARHDIEGPEGLTRYLKPAVPVAQGVGHAAFVALGDRPVIEAFPSALPCYGSRGYGYWSSGSSYSCLLADPDDESAHPFQGQADGFGLAPLAQGALPSWLTVAPVTTPESVVSVESSTLLPEHPESASTSARLINQQGGPLADTIVHFALQSQVLLPTGGADPRRGWKTHYVSDGITDADGIASAEIPLLLLRVQDLGAVPVDQHRFQIFAWTDGVHGKHLPSRSAAPLDVGQG